MFVRKSKYESLVAQRKLLVFRLNSLEEARDYYQGRYYGLASELQSCRSLLKKATASPFSKEELTRLITLCHPDKHGGKKSATEMTQLLLEMRGKL